MSRPGRGRAHNTEVRAERRTEITGHRRGPDRPCATFVIVITIIIITVRVIIIIIKIILRKQRNNIRSARRFLCITTVIIPSRWRPIQRARPSVRHARTHARACHRPSSGSRSVRSTFQIIEGRLPAARVSSVPATPPKIATTIMPAIKYRRRRITFYFICII